MKYIRFKGVSTLILFAVFIQICLLLSGDKAGARPVINLCAKFFYETPSQMVLLNAEEHLIDRTLRNRIDSALAANKQPVVVFDIEGTLYLTQSRILEVLKRYDQQYKTSYFDGMTADRIDPDASFSFIRWAVSQKEFNLHVKNRVMEEIIQFFKQERNKSKYYQYDEVFGKMRFLAQMYHRMGARVILVTERRDLARDATLKQLKRDGIPFDEIFFRPESKETPDIIKLAQIEDIARRDQSEVIALFEDSQSLQDFAGDMRHYDMYQIFVKTRFQDKTFRFYNPIR